MLKQFLFVALLLTTSHALSNTIFIGDSIAHGYKIYNKGTGTTKIGANPKKVLSFIHLANYSNVDKVILSSGISNQCNDISTVKKQLNYLNLNRVKVILLSNNNCYGATSNLKAICLKYSNCKFEYIPNGKDGVHPNQYKIKF